MFKWINFFFEILEGDIIREDTEPDLYKQFTGTLQMAILCIAAVASPPFILRCRGYLKSATKLLLFSLARELRTWDGQCVMLVQIICVLGQFEMDEIIVEECSNVLVASEDFLSLLVKGIDDLVQSLDQTPLGDDSDQRDISLDKLQFTLRLPLLFTSGIFPEHFPQKCYDLGLHIICLKALRGLLNHKADPAMIECIGECVRLFRHYLIINGPPAVEESLKSEDLLATLRLVTEKLLPAPPSKVEDTAKALQRLVRSIVGSTVYPACLQQIKETDVPESFNVNTARASVKKLLQTPWKELYGAIRARKEARSLFETQSHQFCIDTEVFFVTCHGPGLIIE